MKCEKRITTSIESEQSPGRLAGRQPGARSLTADTPSSPAPLRQIGEIACTGTPEAAHASECLVVVALEQSTRSLPLLGVAESQGGMQRRRWQVVSLIRESSSGNSKMVWGQQEVAGENCRHEDRLQKPNPSHPPPSRLAVHFDEDGKKEPLCLIGYVLCNVIMYCCEELPSSLLVRFP